MAKRTPIHQPKEPGAHQVEPNELSSLKWCLRWWREVHLNILPSLFEKVALVMNGPGPLDSRQYQPSGGLTYGLLEHFSLIESLLIII